MVIVLFLVALLAFPAAGRAAGPELEVSIGSSPASFLRGDSGDGFVVSVKNVGVAPTNGGLQLEFRLSAGLRFFAPVSINCPSAESVSEGAPLTCSPAFAIPVQPGQTFGPVGIHTFVATDAPDPQSVTVTVIEAGAPVAMASVGVHVEDRPPFGVAGFEARAEDAKGDDFKVAGGHPITGFTEFSLPTFSTLSPATSSFLVDPFPLPVEEFRDAFTDLPRGLLGNPAAAERCPLAQLSLPAAICPAGSRIGAVTFFNPGPVTNPLYNLVPERGYPAEFGFSVGSSTVVLYPSVRPRSEGYGLTVAVPGASRLHIKAVAVSLFGTPALRNESAEPAIPFLSNPLDCQENAPTTTITIDSWANPARKLASGFPDLSDPLWHSATVPNPQVEGCSDPALTAQWNPTIATTPVQEQAGQVQANSPTGLRVDLHFTQSNDPTDMANYVEPAKHFDPNVPQAPELKTATVALPDGLAISPSGANGLDPCSDQASDPGGDQVHYDDTDPVTCPDASKIGTVTATSPLLAKHDPTTDAVTGPEPITGDVYILAPHPGDLPAGGEGDGTYRLLIQIEDEDLGLNVKLPGVAVANKSTGQLTATFTENPQLPVKDLELEFFNGPRAALSTPKTCGTFTTTTDLEAWSAPGTPDAHPSSSFAMGEGSGCATSLAARPFAPKFEAGTTSSKAGASAPFVLNLSRADSEQELSSLDVTLPKGLTAKLAGIPYCSDPAIASARTMSGAAEQASPSCPAASQVGTATASAGPGSQPYTVTGRAYLAGPYKGAPLSFVFITPAVAGPFDLGNVVVRAAAFVDPQSAQVTVKTDPIPQILDGVPLGIRSLQVKVDRGDFTLNPTDCEAMAVSATVGGASGATASPQNRFQAGDCGSLAFAPKLKVSLKGSTKHTGHPALKAVVTYPQQGAYANIARAQVNLPHSLFLDQANLNKTCTRPVLLAGNCPASTVYGTARAWTPLLDKPLEGNVYLVGGYGYKLPALVADLGGQIRVTLIGKVDSGPNKGLRNTFEAVPDAPVSRFELNMKGGGKYGLLVNSEGLCSKPQKALARFTAQNGLVRESRPVIQTGCGSKAAKGKKHKARHGRSGHSPSKARKS